MSTIKQRIAGIFMLGLSSQALALPIVGEIGFGGSFIPVDSNWSSTGTAVATGIDFNPNLLIVNTATGDFTGASLLGSITDFQFDPSLGIRDGSGGVDYVTSIPDFWKVDAFSFELTSTTRVATTDPDSFLVLAGTGIITAAGFDPTAGSWNFTGNTATSGTFSWSAGSATIPVPEPGTLALLGAGLLLGAGGIRLRRATA